MYSIGGVSTSPPGEGSAPYLGFSFFWGGKKKINDSGFFNANKMVYQNIAEHYWFHWGGVAAGFHLGLLFIRQNLIFFIFYVHCHLVGLFILVSPGCMYDLRHGKLLSSHVKGLFGSNFSLALQNNKESVYCQIASF